MKSGGMIVSGPMTAGCGGANRSISRDQMSRVSELLAELSSLLSSSGTMEKNCQCTAQNGGSPSSITLEQEAQLQAPNGSAIELAPGEYQVTVLPPDGRFFLTSAKDGQHWFAKASRTWHPFNISSSLTLSVPDGDAQNIMVLYPGGGALLASSAQAKTSGGAAGVQSPSSQVVLEAIMKWIPLHFAYFQGALDRNKLLFPPWVFGDIAPDPSPARFAPMVLPPNWTGATVVTCAAPAGLVCAFTPGEAVTRGMYPGYVTSVTSVTVSAHPVIRAGQSVELLVTSVVLNIGHTGIMYATWTDTYQIIAPANGSVAFPGIVLATGRAGSNAPFATWVPDAEDAFTTTPGTGAPVQFELHIDGVTFAIQNCKFNANWYYPESTATPTLICQ